ncbi:hypothetical protein B9Z55_010026 [Caenorhabditis nigoni]|uniref:Sdz-33 F-box domain-containing protein n=1 Tax=Caenorhabditis nigoni TaxID=1611254 RepID=A0A2G5UE37_9PELO|nr:hypothetical protein B9Z55_010026 [Caenorhabditis nigoni]
MPFPILRTSFVVLSEIISLLEPNEIVTASFCSKNVERLLKGHFRQRKPSKWRLFMVDYNSNGHVKIVKSIRIPTTVMMAKHISELAGAADKQNELRFLPEFPVIYSEDRLLGTKIIVDYVTDLLNLDIYGLYVDINGTWAIDWINNRQETMLSGIALSNNTNYNWYGDEIMDYELRNARASDWFFISDVSDTFRYNGKLGPADHLVIDPSSHWVTIGNLMNFDFINILIRETRISFSDLNSFLRHWRAGGSHRLAYLNLEFEMDTNFENFDEDLEIVETNEVRKYRVEAEGDDSDYEIQGGYSIQRMDGVKATINCDLRMFLMVVWHA